MIKKLVAGVLALVGMTDFAQAYCYGFVGYAICGKAYGEYYSSTCPYVTQVIGNGQKEVWHISTNPNEFRRSNLSGTQSCIVPVRYFPCNLEEPVFDSYVVDGTSTVAVPNASAIPC